MVSESVDRQVSECVMVDPAEPSTIYGGSNSSTCSLKVLMCWCAGGKQFH